MCKSSCRNIRVAAPKKEALFGRANEDAEGHVDASKGNKSRCTPNVSSGTRLHWHMYYSLCTSLLCIKVKTFDMLLLPQSLLNTYLSLNSI